MTLRLNGSTNGSVSIDAPATGSNVSFTLPGSVGTSGQLLSTNGSGVLSFVNGGKILQIVRDTDTTDRSTTSTSFTDITGMSVTITPQKSDSAILLIFSAYVNVYRSGNGIAQGQITITDSSNTTISGALSGLTYKNDNEQEIPFVLIGYATPATTSAVTYKARFKTDNAAYTILVRNATSTGQLFAIEVAA